MEKSLTAMLVSNRLFPMKILNILILTLLFKVLAFAQEFVTEEELSSDKAANQNIDALEVLSKVDSFYNAAWDRLWDQALWFFGVVGILFGVVVPILFGFYQRRQLRLESEKLGAKLGLEVAAKMQKQLETAVKQAKAAILHEMTGKMETYDKIMYDTEGAMFHLQANVLRRDIDWTIGADVLACHSFAKACVSYLKAGNEMRCQQMAEQMIVTFSRFDADQWKEIPPAHESFRAAQDHLGKHNENGRYTLLLEKLKKAHDEMLARKKSK